MAFYVFHRHRVCLVDHVDLICSLYSWWEGFVYFLSHTAPGFQLWFYFHLYIWVVHWGLAPEAVLEGLGLPLRGPGVEVVQLLACGDPGGTRCTGTRTASVAGVTALSESFSESLVARDQKTSLASLCP